MLTIGFGPANEDGTGLDWAGTQLSLFDISNATDPQQADVLRLSPVSRENAYSWTWAFGSHVRAQSLPVLGAQVHARCTALNWRWVRFDDRYSHGYYEYITKLMLVEVNESDGELKAYGEVNHSSLFDTDGESYWWDDNNIRRSIFMGDFVYAISSAGVTATNLSTMEESDSLAIPRSSPYDYYEDVAVAETDETGDGEEREQEDSTSSGEADGEDRADGGAEEGDTSSGSDGR